MFECVGNGAEVGAARGDGAAEGDFRVEEAPRHLGDVGVQRGGGLRVGAISTSQISGGRPSSVTTGCGQPIAPSTYSAARPAL